MVNKILRQFFCLIFSSSVSFVAIVFFCIYFPIIVFHVVFDLISVLKIWLKLGLLLTKAVFLRSAFFFIQFNICHLANQIITFVFRLPRETAVVAVQVRFPPPPNRGRLHGAPRHWLSGYPAVLIHIMWDL